MILYAALSPSLSSPTLQGLGEATYVGVEDMFAENVSYPKSQKRIDLPAIQIGHFHIFLLYALNVNARMCLKKGYFHQP